MQRDSRAGVDRRNLIHLALLVLGFLFASTVGFVLVHPLSASPVGYDTAGSVLYFERLVHGQILEQPYGATPKPAMTVIDGLLYSLDGWPAVSLAAVAVYAAVVTFGAELARRIAGSTAGVFAFVALLGSRPLLLDASTAYAVGWASLWLIAAGFALLAERPRHIVVGIALALAALTRLECIVVVVGAVGAVAAWRWLGPRLDLRQAPRSAWFVGLGLLAIPIMLVHDWLLIRNPFYWASISATYSSDYAGSVLGPVALASSLVGHYVGVSVLVVLACLGIAVLVNRRSLGLASGLVLLGPGLGAFLILLAAHGTYVSARYVYLIDLAATFSAAVGFSVVRTRGIFGRAGRGRRSATAIAWAAAAAVALGAGGPFGPLDSTTRGEIFGQRAISANVKSVEPVLRHELALGGAGPAIAPQIVAPGLWTGVITVDLGLQIRDVGAPIYTADGGGYDPAHLHRGELIYLDRSADVANAASSALEAGAAVSDGAFRLVPIAADPDAGWWIYEVSGQP